MPIIVDQVLGLFSHDVVTRLCQGYGGRVDLGTHLRNDDFAQKACSAVSRFGCFGGREEGVCRS